ncbi:DNL-type zinc finger protein [Aspergillus clavatus NRRL 1]|uniref:DNL zinc finger domain protein n=1 Tax=Aspergillus clavatus (strain ATCC 1007 / CBS 513.65 / DSM 816 / NCTC 3887 / NRRL 1 / QM 1276 / 107) TaxID=344612 RepID=A1CTB6_ASPCL|nr:DNL zinc finger domain protein [Aspergillus clavatus NRRL 1]EAW06553.1 DNL zinc finger domain protein [Aspergillus clavatus NRRL 1]
MHSARIASRGLRAFSTALPRTALPQTACRPLPQLLNLTSQRTTALSSTPQRLLAPYLALRNNSSASTSRPGLTDRTPDPTTDAAHEEQNKQRREQEPTYQITFTCKPCGNRSSHRMSKHGYHKGTVVIRCPSCHNRHVISDHLNIFFDKKSTLEDILQREGKKLTRGYVDGDMEFWEDGTVKKREGSDADTTAETKSNQGLP